VNGDGVDKARLTVGDEYLLEELVLRSCLMMKKTKMPEMESNRKE